MTISKALQIAVAQLRSSCSQPRFEAELLLGYHLNKERLYLHLHENKLVEDIEGYQALIARRKAHEPYEYITNSASFYDIELSLSSGVLIPRPETELLVDKVASIIEREKIQEIVEIGVGSGAISIILARKFPHLKITATDISQTALNVASQNIQKFGLQNQITLLRSNLMDKVTTSPRLVVSNPPYIANDFKLEKNVHNYEPHTALFGGEIGDELLHKIIDNAQNRGVEWLACEMGYDQKASIEKYLQGVCIDFSEFYQDFSGFDRGFIAQFSLK